MKIGIAFHDNDFFYTFTNVLEVLLLAFKDEYIYEGDRTDKFGSKTKLLKIINELSLGAYLLFQDRLDFPSSEDDIEHLRKYLKLKDESQIFIGDEVDKYIKDNGGNCNAEFFVLDTDLDHPGNEPVYTT